MFDSLSDKLQGVFRKLGGRGTVSEQDLDEALREVRLALLEADVNYKVVKDFVASVRERALGADVLKSLTPTQQIIGIVNQQMVEVLGGGFAKLERSNKPPTVIMLVGLKGSGKTTTAAKLALHLRRAGERPLLVGADPGRVAAAEQLQSLGKQLSIPVVAETGAIKPEQLARKGLEEAKKLSSTYIIVDTVGHLNIEAEDARALKSLHKLLDPTEVMLPIKFVGMGEKADALEPFHPDRFASRILGMGDLLTLIEKAKSEITEDEAESLTVRMKKGELTLDDFLGQYQRIKRMGPIGNLLGMLPGLSQIKKQLNVADMDEDFFKHTEAIITSMTLAERRHPDLIDGSRRRRIALGSGTKPADVNRVLKQFKEAKKIMQMISTGRGPKVTQFLR